MFTKADASVALLQDPIQGLSAVEPGLGAVAGLRCLVLGAGGFLGRSLAALLQRRGAAVQGFGHSASAARPSALAWTAGAFEDRAALAAALVGQEVVFHLLGSSLPHASNRDPAAHVADQVVPTLRLLELCRAAGVRRMVFASSGGTVYGIPAEVPTPEGAPTAPLSAYGINKLMVEHYLGLYGRLHGLEHQVLRIANPYGPGQSPFRQQGVVAAMLHRALSGSAVEVWGGGGVTRDFIHVDDVATAFVAAALYDGPHRVMNVGSGRGRSLDQVVADVAAAAGRPGLQVVRKPGRPADVPVSILDCGLIQRETGWQAQVGWIDGLAGTAAWVRSAYGL